MQIKYSRISKSIYIVFYEQFTYSLSLLIRQLTTSAFAASKVLFWFVRQGKLIFWNIELFNQPKTISIKLEAKGTLLQELANLGITRSYLFPELEEQAKAIKLRYPPTR